MEFYNKHYIKVDSSYRIVEGWSDGPNREKDTTDAVCINEQGGYQFRLILDGELTEENPPLFTFDYMIPIYKYEGGEVVKRTQEEIDADIADLPVPEPPLSVWDELDAAYTEGVDSV